MLKPLWLALAALGLWASLLPQVTYLSASSGRPSGQGLVAWPSWFVQQDLGHLSGAAGRFRIWVSAKADGDRVTVQASLADAATGEVVRRTSFDTLPLTTRPQTVEFPVYVVPKGQRLLLQLQVAEYEDNYVVYQLAAPQSGYRNVKVNGLPDYADGPLALAHVEAGSGLRAAIVGDPSERIRLVLAAILSVLAVLVHVRVAARLRQAGATVRRLSRRTKGRGRLLVGSGSEPDAGNSPTMLGRILTVPWYPWPVATVPILHFLTSNPLHFSVSEAVLPLAVALVVVTGSMVSLQRALKDWHRPAAATAGATALLFAYGHVERALDGAVDERILFSATVVLGAIVAAVILGAVGLVSRGSQFANLTAAALLVFPIVSLVGGAVTDPVRTPVSNATPDALTAHLPSLSFSSASGLRPDIFYIILDSYGRHDKLGDFDNRDFVQELEHRGFYVASEATSNYRSSIHSIPSSLNLSYLHELGERTPAIERDLLNAAQQSALASILQRLGYAYVHLESGYRITDTSPLADISVTFTPAGVVISDREAATSPTRYGSRSLGDSLIPGRFLRGLVQTTALHPILGQRVLPGQNDPYDWWVADRVLQMFDFLSSPINAGRPKFVFAHIVKPHLPATFDRYGNKVVGQSENSEFSNDHDRSVSSAYIGQLIYVNELTLRAVDAILRNSGDDTVIVIAGDHGNGYSHEILAALRLPNGGNSGLYPSVSSVNHFRYILDYYFDLNIGLKSDQIINLDVWTHDFRRLGANAGQ